MGHSKLNISKISEILKSDETLVKDWQRFYDLLLPHQASESINLGYRFKNGTLTCYELIKDMLTTWEGVNGNQATIKVLQEKLRAVEFNNVADNLEELFSGQEVPRKIINFGIPYSSQEFFGRKSELQVLQKSLKHQGTFLVVLTGMPGIGKSTLVQNFINAEIDQVLCIWLKENFHQSIYKLANHLQLQTITQRRQSWTESFELFKKCINSLEIQNKVWLVLDDLNVPEEYLSNILKCVQTANSSKNALTFQAIVIDRLLPMVLLEAGISPIQIGPLNENDAIEFFKYNLAQKEQGGIKELCSLLGNVPLAMHQAILVINKKKYRGIKRYDAQDLVNNWKKESFRLLNQSSPIQQGNGQKTTFKEWEKTLNKLCREGPEGPRAIKLLKLLSCLSSEGITLEDLKILINPTIFFSYHDGTKRIPNERLLKPLGLLKRYNIIFIIEEKIFVYPIVKEVIHLKFKKLDGIISEVLSQIQFNLIENFDDERKKTFYKIQKPIISLWEYVLENEILEILEKYAPVGVFCTFCKDWSLPLIKKTVIILSNIFQETTQIVLTAKINYYSRLSMRNNLSDTYEGIEMLQNLVQQLASLLGNRHPETQRALELLAETFKDKGKVEEYIKIREMLFEKSLSPFSPSDQISELKKFADLCKEHELYEKSFEYYMTIFVWLKVRNNDKENDKELESLAQNISFCGRKLGLEVVADNFVNINSNIIFDDKDFSSPEEKNVKKKWINRIVPKIVHKFKHWSINDTVKLLQILNLNIVMWHR